MKKINVSIICFVLVVLIAYLFVGCDHSSSSMEKNLDKSIDIDIVDTTQKISNQNELPSRVIEETETGSFFKKTSGVPFESKIHLIYDYAEYGDKVYHDSYIAIETENGIIEERVGDVDSGSYGDTMYVCDIDGDRLDEIIVHSMIGVSGGAGQYAARVYKIVDNEIEEIFFSVSSDMLDTGFLVEFRDDFEIVVKNKYTGYNKVFERSFGENYSGIYFDENGKVLEQSPLWLDSFREFIPEDRDGDGIYEIKAVQYASLYGHTDFIGNAVSILKYNSKTSSFEVIESDWEDAKTEDGSVSSPETTE